MKDVYVVYEVHEILQMNLEDIFFLSIQYQ